jgi:uncharacterized protein YbaR (Trm112 family)
VVFMRYCRWAKEGAAQRSGRPLDRSELASLPVTHQRTPFWIIAAVLGWVIALGACLAQRHDDTPVVPRGFDLALLKILACPENLTPVRLASVSELEQMNKRVRLHTLKRWSGALVTTQIEAALIREDNKVAYEVRQGVPIMLIPEALVLESSVGSPDPQKYRRQPVP